MRVVCTAGHVDHGKSTLVTALTGMEPDRLEEEQRRGLTIELGFAWTAVEGVGDVAFVDLPGHERFVPNMLAGAGQVPVALFVVAADEGWKPQSAEHLAILDLLEVRGAVVALTRCDLVDEETVGIATELVGEDLAGSRLAGAPVVPVSAVTGRGLEALRRALAACLTATPESPDVGRPRLWVDRAFTVRGAGTVVTGTLLGGAVRRGDHMRVLPAGRSVRVRGLQALERDVDVAHPGWRVALNLGGVDVGEVGRGDAVVGGAWRATDVVEAWCRPVEGEALRRRGAWTVHVGTAATPATVHPVGGADLTTPGPVRLELARALPLVTGDRLVLREAGRGITAGGGVVLEPAPGPRVRGAAARAARHDALAGVATTLAGAAPDPAQRVAALVALRDVAPTAELLGDADAPEATALPAGVEPVGAHLMAAGRWRELSRVAVAAVAEEHEAHPARAAADKASPRQRLAAAGTTPAVAEAVLDRLVDDGVLDAVPGGLAVPGHEPRLTEAQRRARTALLATLDAAGVEPPPLATAAGAAGADEDLLAAMRADGELVDLPGLGAAVTATTVAAVVGVLRGLEASAGPFTASAAREALGTSRRFALPLLEVLDAAGHTSREGDLRRLRRSR